MTQSRRFRNYLAIGLVAFGVEYLTFLLIINSFDVRNALIIAQSTSFLCGLLVSFTGNRLITFLHSSKEYTHSLSRQLGSYMVLAVLNLGLSNFVIWILVEQLSVYASIAKLLVMGMIISWNFVIFEKIIFKSK